MPDVGIKPQRYRDERPKEHFDRYHARVRAGEPEAKVYEVVRVLTVLGSYHVRNWKRLQFPRVTVSYGEPFRFEVEPDPSREHQQEAADYILERIRELHSELQRLGHRGAPRAARERARQPKAAQRTAA